MAIKVTKRQLSIIGLLTRKRSKGQRVARPTHGNATAFLRPTYLQTGYVTAA